MLNRRRTLQTGLATLFSAAAAPPAFAQAKPPVKVRYNEVVRSILYAPAYVAITKGYFKDAGLDVTLTTAQGGDKSVAALLSNSADIALIGPETAIYVQNSDSPTKSRIFCGLTSTDGFMLVGPREGRQVRLEDAQGQGDPRLPARQHAAPLPRGGAAPERHRSARTSSSTTMSAIPARVGSWLAGQNQYAIFIEPDASQLELDGKAHFLASIGETVGLADYTTFMATDKYIARTSRRHPDLDRRDLPRRRNGRRTAPTAEIVERDRASSSRASIRRRWTPRPSATASSRSGRPRR